MPLPRPADDRTLLRLGHSPDPDDAFMWWPLFELQDKPSQLNTGRWRFQAVATDIESLNQRAETAGDLEITAISCAHYPAVKNRYALTACGSSMGEHYGPKLVSARPMTLEDLTDRSNVIAIPGERTSAFAALRLLIAAPFRHACIAFDEITQRVASGEFAAGLVIHEDQLRFEDAGLHLIVDLGAWWTGRSGLPLPLGVNVIRRDLEQLHGAGTLTEITALLRQSVDYALAHRQVSIQYALGYARNMPASQADRFISMYVNGWTLDFGPVGRKAVEVFLSECWRAGLTREPGRLDVVQQRR